MDTCNRPALTSAAQASLCTHHATIVLLVSRLAANLLGHLAGARPKTFCRLAAWPLCGSALQVCFSHLDLSQAIKLPECIVLASVICQHAFSGVVCDVLHSCRHGHLLRAVAYLHASTAFTKCHLQANLMNSKSFSQP